ncbi:MAG: sigma-70 family RNA polymerase sigma factor [Bacteroidales bacterium]|nr:sigma-70 family RNA polymerase sigma factor [Bacteroidales bacterium]
MQTDEQRLIARVLDGHAEDYGYFLERYGSEVFALVARLVPRQEDAEELTQDAFVRAFNRLDSFGGRSSFSTWICRIAYNTVLSWQRRRRMTFLSIDDQPQLTDTEVDEALDDEARIGDLRRAIAQLKPDEQTLVTLYYYDSRPLADIAYILDLEPGTIATRLHRIRRKLYLLMKHGNNR